MTTSPKRIKHITQVISAIDLSKVEKIYINLPERFGRDGSVYQIPGELLNHPKVVINRIPVDLGPITKILPAAEIIQKIDADAWIISIDDDIHYNRYLIRDFANAKAAHPFAVISGSGQAADYWGISNFPGHAENYAIATKSTALSPVDIVEGFAGIIYRAGDLDVARLKQMSATSKAAFASDDLVLSYALGERGVQKLRLESRRYGTHAIHELEYGFQEDALHRGAGVTSTATEGNMNAEKYREAFRGLQKWKTPRCRTTELLKLLSPVPSSQ